MSEMIEMEVEEAPPGILEEDWAQSIIGSLYAATPELGSDINEKIQSRTPVYMGNLVASEKFIPNTDPDAGPDLVNFFPNDQEQLDELGRGRIYAQYIEGVVPTDWPVRVSHMYGRSEDEDIDDIELWAYQTIQGGVSKITGGTP
jgi:hypothetical protein